MGLGYVEGVTHDYYRHRTTTLFAALDVLHGSVITQCKPRHRHQEFLGFLKHLDASIPPGLEVHLIADNYGTHKHSKVKACPFVWTATADSILAKLKRLCKVINAPSAFGRVSARSPDSPRK